MVPSEECAISNSILRAHTLITQAFLTTSLISTSAKCMAISPMARVTSSRWVARLAQAVPLRVHRETGSPASPHALAAVGAARFDATSGNARWLENTAYLTQLENRSYNPIMPPLQCYWNVHAGASLILQLYHYASSITAFSVSIGSIPRAKRTVC